MSFSSTLEAGLRLFQTAEHTGFGEPTAVFGVGDSAERICAQFEAQFGSSASNLLDLYHLCNYLAAAAPKFMPANPALWLENQKQRLKENRWKEVIHELEGALHPEKWPDKQAPALCAYRYLSRPPEQLDYAGAIAAELPVGSGSHRERSSPHPPATAQNRRGLVETRKRFRHRPTLHSPC